MAASGSKKESPMAFELAPHDSFQPDMSFGSPPNGNSRHSSNPTSPIGRVTSPQNMSSFQNTLLSPASNSQAVFSASSQSRSEHSPNHMLPGNPPSYWYDLLQNLRTHIDNERLLHQQEVQGLRNEIRALQAQLGNAAAAAGPSGIANGTNSNGKSLYPDHEMMRRSREGLERIRQPSVDVLERSRSVSPNKYPPPPPSIASVRGPTSRLTSIDELVPSSAGASHGLTSSTTVSPLDAQTPHSPPTTAVAGTGATAQTPAFVLTSHHNQRQRRSSEAQLPESIDAAARAMNALSHQEEEHRIDGTSEGSAYAGKNLDGDPCLSGQLSLPHNPNGVNSRKSEEFLAAMWNKVNDNAEPAVMRSLDAQDAAARASEASEALHGDEIEEIADGPILKTQKSINFGAPMGSLGGMGRR